jgi:hypothetical protein
MCLQDGSFPSPQLVPLSRSLPGIPFWLDNLRAEQKTLKQNNGASHHFGERRR